MSTFVNYYGAHSCILLDTRARQQACYRTVCALLLALLDFCSTSLVCYDRKRKIRAAGEQFVSKQAEIEVTFYTKAGCHLCENARELLEEIAQETPYALTEIDIRSDMAIFDTYRYRIPVIIIDQETLLEGRIDADELTRAFQQAKGE